ncbi:MAG: phage Gp19/Gp15/Gp42 family protein [Clostridiales bacterium]|nr:phage Gp19/Gp15/Gp42 family protein [Clostridiales bacterium]
MITISDVITLFRPLSKEEIDRAEALIEVVESSISSEAKKVGKDITTLLEDKDYLNVYKSVVVDVVARTLMTSTDKEPMIQESQSALGYSFSGTYLVPGGGLFIKKTELSRLGLRNQRYGGLDFYDSGNNNLSDRN